MSSIDNNLAKIVCIQRSINAQCASLDVQIQELQKERDAIAEPYESEIKDLEQIIISDVISEGHSYEGPLAKVNYRKGYSRVTWNNDKLEGYGKVHPEVLDFKKVTPVSPNAFIKLNPLQ